MPTVAQLRAELKKRGLDTSGLKAVLEARLDEAKASEAAPPEPEVPAPESRKRARGNDAAQEGYYQEIDGVKYDRALIELAGELSSGGKLSAASVDQLLEASADGGKVTPTEVETLQYIAETYKLDKKAKAAMDKGLAAAGGSTVERSLDVDDGGGGGGDGGTPGGSSSGYYQEIDGVKYDRALIELAEELSSGGKLSAASVDQLLEASADGGKVTPTEVETLQYIAETYKLDKKAKAAMDKGLAAAGGSTVERSLDVDDGGGGGGDGGTPGGSNSGCYQEIDGVKYDRALIELAEELSSGGKLSAASVDQLLEASADGGKVTPTEVETLQYIAETYKLDKKAAALLKKAVHPSSGGTATSPGGRAATPPDQPVTERTSTRDGRPAVSICSVRTDEDHEGTEGAEGMDVEKDGEASTTREIGEAGADAEEAASRSQGICRGCGGSGRDLFGNPCVCPAGVKLASAQGDKGVGSSEGIGGGEQGGEGGEQAARGMRFPSHWGTPPLRQTRDLRPLPGGYGQGSSTLARWIEEKMAADAAPEAQEPTPPAGTCGGDDSSTVGGPPGESVARSDNFAGRIGMTAEEWVDVKEDAHSQLTGMAFLVAAFEA